MLAFIYPEDRTGIVYLADEQEIEIYCTSGFAVPADVLGNSALAKCVDGNLFEVKSVVHTFKDFTCNGQAFHTARKSGKHCFNGAALVEIGFDLGNRFPKVLEVCHDEVTEETYYAKFQLTPATEGVQKFKPLSADSNSRNVSKKETMKSGKVWAFSIPTGDFPTIISLTMV